jgi:hypothetical protein
MEELENFESFINEAFDIVGNKSKHTVIDTYEHNHNKTIHFVSVSLALDINTKIISSDHKFGISEDGHILISENMLDLVEECKKQETIEEKRPQKDWREMWYSRYDHE